MSDERIIGNKERTTKTNKQTKQLNQNWPSAPRIQGLYLFCYLPYRQGDRVAQTGKLVFNHMRLTLDYQQMKIQISNANAKCKSYLEFTKKLTCGNYFLSCFIVYIFKFACQKL